MAAVSQTQSGRGYPQSGEARQWGHKKNSSSQDSRHNFSYPGGYSQSTPPASPQRRDDYNNHPRVLSNEASASSFAFGDATSENNSNRAVNRLDNPRPRHANESGRNFGYGSVSSVQNQTRALQNGLGAAKEKESGSKQDFNFDDDKWIHRDKLTAIEIQEHIALGKEVPAELLRKMEEGQQRSSSRSHRPDRSLDYGSVDSSKRQRLATPSPEYGSYDEEDEPFVPEDPRSPDEIAADGNLNTPPVIYQQRLRSSSSRIPVSTNSPLPVPQEHLDRNTVLPRKRGASNDFGGDSIVYPGTRSRSHSVGSQVLLDDDFIPSNPGSPSKAKAPGKGTPAGRKASSNTRVVSTAKSRAVSGARNTSGARPTTRDGRPNTVNRPEGDPPWLASMYRPDPRLPPDQQIIPTHAKRMMQEQWEKEGKSGQVYDRDFRPIALYPDGTPPRGDSLQPAKDVLDESQQGLKPSRHGTPEPQRLQLSPQITRGSLNEQQSPTRSTHTNGEAHARYSTMPKVQSTPVIGSASPKPETRERFDIEEQQNNEKGAKSKGCGCCIIM